MHAARPTGAREGSRAKAFCGSAAHADAGQTRRTVRHAGLRQRLGGGGRTVDKIAASARQETDNCNANITFGCLAGVNYVALEDQKNIKCNSI